MSEWSWGNESKPRPHSGRLGMDKILKDARRGDLAAVKKHLKADPTLLLAKSGGHNRTFLWEAARGNRIEIATFLLKAGADPNVPGRIRAEIPVLLKPYCIAVRYRRRELIKLLETRTEIDVYSACYLRDVNCVREWLKREPSLLTAEQEEESVWRVTPLHYAVTGGHEELVRELIERGALVAPYTRLLCDAAVRMKHLELIPLLVAGGADPDLVKIWGKP